MSEEGSLIPPGADVGRAGEKLERAPLPGRGGLGISSAEGAVELYRWSLIFQAKSPGMKSPSSLPLSILSRESRNVLEEATSKL